MCGIVGYAGKPAPVQLLVDGLTRLAYRGYDSAGIAFLNGKGLEVYKTQGNIQDLQRILPVPVPSIRVGIGHTRWATHGEPSTKNAHPHTAAGVTVVHNGIIENYRLLRESLEREGTVFLSQTDTEVVPHLIVRHLRAGRPIIESILKAVSELRGSYALGIMHDDSPDRVFALRNGSPLVLGVADDGYYIASDVPAILPHTRKFLFLEDGQMAILRQSGIELMSLAPPVQLPVAGRIVSVDWPASVAEKQGYDHFMLKEIHEQPQGVANTLREWIDNTDLLVNELKITGEIRNLRRLHIAACGTSYHAGLVGRYLIEKFVRIPVAVDIASEFRYMSPVLPKGTAFITITQSGETADTLAAQREAKNRGAATFTICNVLGSTSSREADSVLYTRAGPEIGVASTKAFTAQLAALSLLGLALGMKKGKLNDTEIRTLKTFLLELPRIMEQALRIGNRVSAVAQTLVNARTILYLGRGINYPVALEGALKMKELSYIHAEGYPAGEMKHGPIALIENGVPAVFLATMDELHEKIFSNIEEVRARGGRIIVITDAPAAFQEKADQIIVVPSTHPALVPFVNVIPLQLLAYHVAVMKGCNVDQPRNLAKSVTVE
jgi:glucosamine--fructose-6-phosphate aminotransferase (isomerizing)